MNGFTEKDKNPYCQIARILYLILTGSASKVSDTDYHALFQIAAAFHLEFLFWRSFGIRFQDPAEKTYSADLQRKMLIQSMQLESARNEVKKLFLQHEIRFCFFKGADLAFRVYPAPDARVMGDIDVLVHPHDDEKAYNLLKQYGWLAEADYKHSHHRPVMQKKNVMLEQHFAFPGTDASQMQILWDDSRAFKPLQGSEFQLCPELNCCMLFNHAARHDWHNAHYLLADIFMLLYADSLYRLNMDLIQHFCQVCRWLNPVIFFEAYRDYLPESVLPESEEYTDQEKNTFRYVMAAAPAIDDFDSAGKIYRTSVFSRDFWQKVKIALWEPQRFMERDADGKSSFRYWRQKNFARLKAFFRIKFCRISDTEAGLFMKKNRDLLEAIRKKSG